MLLQIQQLSKYFGDHPIVENIDLTINPQDRIGLVGRNGVGKTTLLQILAGTMEFDSGHRHQKAALSIGYLQQDIDFTSGQSLLAEMASVFPELAAMELRMQEIEKRLSENPDPDSKAYQRLMGEYGSIQYAYEQQEGYSFHARVRTILNGLGFSDSAQKRDVGLLSGGEKMRLHLGKLLLMEPDLLLLDEPNNHLDMDTMEWLESYLLKWKKAMVVISHDRYFLDHVITSIAELESRNLRVSKGNYSAYTQTKEARMIREEKEYLKQQQQIKHLDAYIDRFRYKATKARQAQSKIKAKERLEPVERTHISRKNMNLRLSVDQHSEREVLLVENLEKKFTEIPLFTSVSFTLRRGDRVGILGPNGIGKSTLLKMLVGQDPHYQGRVVTAPRATIGYFAQDLPLDREDHRVLDEILALASFTEGEARSLLGLFLFTGEEVFKKVSMLSGGERNRLALAKLVTRQANLLVLDEPTNHLDIEAREVLESSLQDYPGTLILVSHDRYFLQKVVNRILVLGPKGVRDFPDGYDAYREHLEQQKTVAQAEPKKKPAKEKTVRPEDKRRQEARRKQELQETETAIENLETEKRQAEAEMADPDLYEQGSQVKETVRRYEDLQKGLEALYLKWEQLQPAGRNESGPNEKK